MKISSIEFLTVQNMVTTQVHQAGTVMHKSKRTKMFSSTYNI